MTTTKPLLSPPPPLATIQHQSTVVPYLFGGLAAMLGLIALALLILACSYWKRQGGNDERDLEAAGDEKLQNSGEPMPVLEEKIVVIMAGDVKPTFLATPMSARDSCFSGKSEEEEGDKADESEKPKENLYQAS
ncbi:hypothetical protein LguiA_036635 [Lonicera macranthoides]